MELPLGFTGRAYQPFSALCLVTLCSSDLFHAISVTAFEAVLPLWWQTNALFLSHLVTSSLQARASGPEGFTNFYTFIVGIFSYSDSDLEFSSVCLMVSSLVLARSTLLPVAPVEGSSTCLACQDLLCISSVLSLLSVFYLSHLDFSCSSLDYGLASTSYVFLVLLEVHYVLSLDYLCSLIVYLSFPLLGHETCSSVCLSGLSEWVFTDVKLVLPPYKIPLFML